MPSNPYQLYVDYGQGQAAFNPESRSPIYQQVDKAKTDNSFAQLFAADILLGKESSGGIIYGTNTQNGLQSSLTSNYLKNQNTLNASQSWVPQAFGNAAIKGSDGNWYSAALMANGEIKRVRTNSTRTDTATYANWFYKQGDGYSFIQGERINDANTIRMLNEGHYAFSAKGFDGQEVYLTWANDFVPSKGNKGLPERGGSKDEIMQKASQQNAANVGVGQLSPGNIMGGRATLLGENKNTSQKSKTLLGN